MWKRLLCLLWAMVLCFGSAAAQTVTMTYAPNQSDVFANPFCGIVAWASDDGEREQPFTLVYANLRWADFEPEEGVYDFEAFETHNHFEKWRAEGKRLILRFVIDIPGSKKHMDIPEWLYKQTKDGVQYKTDYGRGYSPNYENQTLIDAHSRAIGALAERYGDDRFIAYIQLGSVGHWGEWHINDDIGDLPDMAVLNEYVEPYIGAFPHAFLMARRPFGFAAEGGIGLYNDTSADPQSTETWLEWIRAGGSYQGVEGVLQPMPEAWRTAPIGGEIATSLSVEEILTEEAERTVDLFSASHTSWIGPHGFDDVERGGDAQPALDDILRHVGYRLRVKSAALTMEGGDARSLTLRWRNDGFAPFYFKGWAIQLRCVTPEGQTTTVDFPLELNDIAPGRTVEASVELPQGAYTVYVGVTDPDTGEAAVSLAMHTPSKELWYELMTVEP